MATGLLLNPFARLLFMEANKGLNRKAHRYSR
jgi:hypothetical protein